MAERTSRTRKTPARFLNGLEPGDDGSEDVHAAPPTMERIEDETLKARPPASTRVAGRGSSTRERNATGTGTSGDEDDDASEGDGFGDDSDGGSGSGGVAGKETSKLNKKRKNKKGGSSRSKQGGGVIKIGRNNLSRSRRPKGKSGRRQRRSEVPPPEERPFVADLRNLVLSFLNTGNTAFAAMRTVWIRLEFSSVHAAPPVGKTSQVYFDDLCRSLFAYLTAESPLQVQLAALYAVYLLYETQAANPPHKIAASLDHWAALIRLVEVCNDLAIPDPGAIVYRLKATGAMCLHAVVCAATPHTPLVGSNSTLRPYDENHLPDRFAKVNTVGSLRIERLNEAAEAYVAAKVDAIAGLSAEQRQVLPKGLLNPRATAVSHMVKGRADFLTRLRASRNYRELNSSTAGAMGRMASRRKEFERLRAAGVPPPPPKSLQSHATGQEPGDDGQGNRKRTTSQADAAESLGSFDGGEREAKRPKTDPG